MVLLKMQLDKLIKTVIFKWVQSKYLTVTHQKLPWVDFPSFYGGRKETWNLLSLGAMTKIIVRCLSDMGGILHGPFDFSLPHKVWHTVVSLATQVSDLSVFPEGFIFSLFAFLSSQP